MLSNGVLLLNCHLKPAEMDLQILPHPPHSLDLAPYLHLRGTHFKGDESVQIAVPGAYTFLRSTDSLILPHVILKKNMF
jgi:hypothetical protein